MSGVRPDIPYVFSDEIVPPTVKAPYVETSFETFVSMLNERDPEGLVWMYSVGDDRVIRRSAESLDRIDSVYAAITRELLDKYNMHEVHVHMVYNISDAAFLAIYWNADEAEINIGMRQPTVALNMYWVRYMPVRAIHDTILHEIAHSLTEGNEHDDVWRSVAIGLGSSGRTNGGAMDPYFIPENRYDSAVIFQCVERCFECFGKIVRDEVIIRDILDDCDSTTGELKNSKMRCLAHNLPIFLLPPQGMSTLEYIHDLSTQHDDIGECIRNS